MPRARFLCALFLFLVAGVLTARAEILPIRYYTTSDGLAHDRINRIVRDSRGFLWFCTAEGLSRFDGYQFKNYTRDAGLPHRAVQDLLEMADGTYWVATGDGLAWFNPNGVGGRWRGWENQPATDEQSRMFRVFRPDDIDGDWSVAKIALDKAGTVWVVSLQGLYRVDRDGSHWKITNRNRDEWKALLEMDTLCFDQQGALWIAGRAGLFRLLPDDRVQVISDKLSIISLYPDRTGNVWAGTRGEGEGGLYQFAISGLDAPKLLRRYTTKDGLPADLWLNSLYEARDGSFRVGAASGMAELNPATGVFRLVSKIIATDLQEDIGGNLWVGTGSNGAARLTRGGLITFAEAEGLTSTQIRSIVNGTSGELLMLTEATTINRFADGKFTAISPLQSVPRHWGWNQVDFQDHEGAWWVAGQSGLQRYPRINRLEDLALTRPLRLYTSKDGLSVNAIFRMSEDSRGDIWIGTLGDGKYHLARWQRATDSIQVFKDNSEINPESSPSAFGEDRAGNIWIGFYNGDLFRYRNDVFHKFTREEGHPGGFIREIFTDSRGRVWVASAANGVIRIDEPNAERPALVNITTVDGLSSNQATCITEDQSGRVYVGTGRGINRLDLQTGGIKLFTTADGLSQNMVNVCRRDRTGALWFGQYQGLSRLVPETEQHAAPPPIFISDVLVNGATIRKLSELGHATVEGLNLGSDQRQIQIGFFALGFSSGESLRYQYQLDDSGWSPLTIQRTINLSLAPGAHRFLVRAVNAEGMNSMTPAIVSFSIARPVWQRWWFLTLAALIMASLAYTLYRYRLAQLLKVERVRTRIATDLHDDIGASLSRMAILSEVVKQQTVAGKGHQSTTMLSEIADSARGLVDSMGDIVWSIDPRRDDLQSVVRRIRQFASDVLEAKAIDWQLQVSPEVESLKLDPEKRQHLFLIFKEAINNIARHGKGAKSVSMSIRIEGRELVAEVKDDGCGFTPDERGDSTTRTRGGNGLPNMRERAAQVRGRLDITSAAGAGTRMHLKMPIR